MNDTTRAPRVLVDADACPVIGLIEDIARAHGVPVTLLCDSSHLLVSDYSEVRTVGVGRDAVDLALINLCERGDAVVTQDYGVAAMALGKGARAMHHSGMRYTQENIDTLLMERYLKQKERMGKGKRHLKGPKKRTREDDERFRAAFDRLMDELCVEQREK